MQTLARVGRTETIMALEVKESSEYRCAGVHPLSTKSIEYSGSSMSAMCDGCGFYFGLSDMERRDIKRGMRVTRTGDTKYQNGYVKRVL